MRGLRRLLLSAVLAALSATGARADIIIDNFTTTGMSVANTNPSTSVFQGGAASGAIGGARVVTVVNGPNVFNSTATVTPALGRFDFASQVAPPPNASTFTLKYDGSIGSALNPTGLGGIDILAQGGLGINLVADNTSNNVEPVSFRFYTNATSYSDATVNVPSGAANSKFFVPFGAFVEGAGAAAPANFHSLGALVTTISYGNQQGSAGSIESISFAQPAVPEPSSLALSGLASGLVGAGYWLRRRKLA
jgi:hypothetical protein